MGAILSSPLTSKVVQRRGNSVLRAAVATMQGWRITHEDAHICFTDVNIEYQGQTVVGIFSVFDGHGGSVVANFCAAGLGKDILRKLENQVAPLDDVIISSFLEIDKLIGEDVEDAMNQGTTCVLAIVFKTGDEFRIKIANLGDSRALMCNGPMEDPTVQIATEDHKPGQLEEQTRIENAGGFVSNGDPPRVDDRLAVSRAFGDFEYKQNTDLDQVSQKVSPLPDLYEATAKNGDFLVLCCDGIFDVKENSQVATFIGNSIGEKKDLGDVCANLLTDCLVNSSRDNMTCLVVQFENGEDFMGICDELKPGDVFAEHDEDLVKKYDSFAVAHGFETGRPANSCSACGRYMHHMQQCPCRLALYCGRKCQKAAWKDHRSECSHCPPSKAGKKKAS